MEVPYWYQGLDTKKDWFRDINVIKGKSNINLEETETKALLFTWKEVCREQKQKTERLEKFASRICISFNIHPIQQTENEQS